MALRDEGLTFRDLLRPNEAASGYSFSFRRNLSAIAVCSLLAVVSLPASASAAGDVSVPVPDTDKEMLTAFAKAAASLDDFLTQWQHPSAGTGNFSIKIGLKDVADPPGYALVHPGTKEPGKEVEWFWIRSLRTDGAGFAAEIDNDPDTIKNVRSGQTIRFTRQDIGDWMYMKNGKIVGNATMCPALAHASEADRQMMKVQFGVVCN